LYWAGAGLFKGFAVTTIIGITAGVFVSRPAFAEMVGKMVKKDEESN
jgi:preprotein translocase subunit SecD